METEANDTSEIKETEPDEIKETEHDEIKGTLIEKEATRAFFKDTGEFGFVTKIKIKDDKGEKHITIWDEKVKEIQKYKIGDQILLKNVTLKQNNGRTELHANGHCAIEQIK